MAAPGSEDGIPATDAAEPIEERRRRWRMRKIAGVVGLSLLLILLFALIALWIARRPIATNILEREFERRGVEASYQLERVGLRTQVVRNLRIGDEEDPDLVARYAVIQLRPRWTGSIEVYRIVARGVRLEGKLVDGKISWGQLDKLLPPPSGKPFSLPDIVVDVADTSISLQTPTGPIGLALAGSGNLTGGFEGHVAAASPGLDLGDCRIDNVNALWGIKVSARRPSVEGPVGADRLLCPESSIALIRPSFNIDADFNDELNRFDGEGRLAAQMLNAGSNRLARINGRLTFRGSPADAGGEIELAAQQSRLGGVNAGRTRIDARYAFDGESGSLTALGGFGLNDATLPPAMVSQVTDPLGAIAKTPLGPIATAIGNAIGRSARDFDADGDFRLVNFKGGGAIRVESANVRAQSGGRIAIDGGDGVTYYWPSGRLRLDGRVAMSGGGLPNGELVLRQPRDGGPMSGYARLAPYQVGRTQLAMQPIRFRDRGNGAMQFNTVAQLSGPFEDGLVRDLRLPIAGQFGGQSGLLLGQGCVVASFDFLRFRELSLSATRLPICPAGQSAIIVQRPGGSMSIGADIRNPRLRGRLGSSPFALDAASARILGGRNFSLANATMRLGDPAKPVVFSTDRLQGTFAGSGVSGTFTNGEATIGAVPLRISESNADWRFYKGDLIIEDDLLLSDTAAEPRFYPLRSNDFRLTLSGNDIRATGSLRHPDSGIKVTDVDIAHDLSTGAGHADLDVPGITFGEDLQPEELTRLTEGVIALVQGTLRGQGRINWSGEGAVTSTGEFSTVGMDLAAPFGPVENLSTTIRFTDLLGLETAPGQVATVGSINPGIPVEGGVIRYQLLPDQLVKIERGEWPFMGGRLILQETILNFGAPSAKRLTFEVVGFNAKTFIDTLGFQGLEITGVFDGVLPMIFDESGGRIVGGRLDSRPPGGEFAYTGTKPDAGMVAGVAFDLLSNIRYQQMTIRLDGDLAGEFATRFEINQVSLGDRGGFLAGLVRGAFKKVPMKVNLNIKGPFRALIQTAKGFKDPTEVIQPVMPFPLDAPGVVTETRVLKKEEEQDRITPIDEVDVSTEPPPESEQ